MSIAMFAAVSTGAALATSASSDDSSFVQTAQHDALGNYALAVLAHNKAQNPTAKALAQRVLADAESANTFIKNYARSHDVAIDNKPSLRADAQYGNLTSDTGKSFDQEFASDMNVDATFDQDAYQDEAKNGTDPALRNFAKQQLAFLQQVSAEASKLSQ